jgi:hypothetical protein
MRHRVEAAYRAEDVKEPVLLDSVEDVDSLIDAHKSAGDLLDRIS